MSAELVISEAMEAFVGTSIRSLEELEVLLAGKSRMRDFTNAELSASLQIPESLVDSALQSLTAAGVFARKGSGQSSRYEYAPETAHVELAVDELARATESHRIEVIMLISSKAIERVRSGVLRMFVDSPHGSTPKKSG